MIQFCRKIFGITTLSPVTGTYPALAVPLCPILTSHPVVIQHTFALTSVATVV